MATNQGMFQTNFSDNVTVHTTSDSTRLASAFPNSPIHSGVGDTITDFSRAGVTSWFQDNVLDASQTENLDFGTQDLNFNHADVAFGPPVLDGEAAGDAGGVTTGAGGLPGSHHGPNLATSDDENKPFDASSITAVVTKDLVPTWGSGHGIILHPQASSLKISGQKIKELDFGRSAPQITTESSE